MIVDHAIKDTTSIKMLEFKTESSIKPREIDPPVRVVEVLDAAHVKRVKPSCDPE